MHSKKIIKSFEWLQTFFLTCFLDLTPGFPADGLTICQLSKRADENIKNIP